MYARRNGTRRIDEATYFSGIGCNVDCPELLTQRLPVTDQCAYHETATVVTIVGHSIGGLLPPSCR